MSMFETGTAVRSKHNPDPILHLIVRGADGWQTWCGGGAALNENTVTHRRCSRCLALARADLVANGIEENEESDLDWYLQRRPRRDNSN